MNSATTALITHNAHRRMADRVVRFGDGHIVEVTENGSPARRLEW